jgi:H+/gluconate symporter-like permease
MAIAAVVIAILILVVLITGLKLNPFLAFLVSAISAAIMLGIPLDKIHVGFAGDYFVPRRHVWKVGG